MLMLNIQIANGEVDSGTHSCCTLAIGKYQIYKLISRHRVARYELVGLIFFGRFFCGFFVDISWIIL